MKNNIISIMNIAMAVLCIAAVALLANTAIQCAAMDDNEITADEYAYFLEKDDYCGLASRVAHDKEIEGEESLYVAVADYFKAASFYKVYQECGEQEYAGKYKADMDKAVSEMGTLVGEKDKIDTLLGLTE